MGYTPDALMKLPYAKYTELEDYVTELRVEHDRLNALVDGDEADMLKKLNKG